MPIIGGGTGGGGGAEVLLASQIRGSNGQFDISSIPQTSTHLKVILMGRSTAAAVSDTVNMQLNGDVGNNYYSELGKFTAVTAAGVSETLAAAAAVMFNILPAANGTLTNSVGVGVYWFPFYTNTNFLKSWTGTCYGAPSGTTTNVATQEVGGTWNSTAAINRIVMAAGSLNFATNSAMYIYGLT